MRFGLGCCGGLARDFGVVINFCVFFLFVGKAFLGCHKIAVGAVTFYGCNSLASVRVGYVFFTHHGLHAKTRFHVAVEA
jgi:hypothetical protein